MGYLLPCSAVALAFDPLPMLHSLLRAGLALVFLASLAAAQSPPVSGPGRPTTGAPALPAAPDSATLQSEAIRVFLDCQGSRRGCDRDFFVTEINFVNWMRDRFDSDVQILSQALSNGGGGTEYTVTFLGRGRFDGLVDTLILNTLPNDADDRIRRELARTYKLGLARFVARSPLASRMNLAYAAPFGAQQQRTSAAGLKDKWNLWTFSTNFTGDVRAEERQQSLNTSLSLSANRSTADWKLNFSVSGNVNEQQFKIPASVTRPAFTVTNEQRTYNLNSLVVKTLSGHLSAGMKVGAGYSDFLNHDVAVRVQPALEYNFFPWTQQTQRQFTFLYNVGPNYYDYQRTTVFDQDRETRFSQQLTASYVARQQWGTTNVSLDWLNYLHDFQRNALTLSGVADLRIGRGLSLTVRGSAAKVNDQIYLPAQGNSEEEILLQRQALETGFRLSANVGIRYTFGSIYNTIVNQRFSSLGSSGGRFNFQFF